MPRSNNPLAPREPRRPPAPLATRSQHPAPLARVQPPAFVQPASETKPPSPTRRRWPVAVRILVGALIAIVGVVAVLGALVLVGQTQLVATIIVGAVLVAVFGTPLLCVIGLFVFYVWAVTRMGRARHRQQPEQARSVRRVAETVVVGEVLLDE